MKRQRLLAFSFFPAFTPPMSGGETRLFEIYGRLSEFFDVTLLSSGYLHAPVQTVVHRPAFTEIRIEKGNDFADAWSKLAAEEPGGEFSGIALAMAGGRIQELHRQYLSHYQDCDIIVHDSPFTVPYDLFFGFDDKPRVYNSYNAEHVLAQHLYKGPKAGEIAAVVASLERRLIEGAALVTVCSEEDGETLKVLASGEPPPFIKVPNGVATLATHVHRADATKSERGVFIGSGHRPNVEAARFIVSRIAPALPGVVFDIVGGCLDEDEPLPPNVVRHGVVSTSERERILATADFAINPMAEGSGSSLKVPDFLSYGLPLLSTAFGARGFDLTAGQHYVACGLETFVEDVREALASPQTLAAIGKAGQRHIEENYEWGVIARRFAATLSGLSGARSNILKDRFILGLNDYSVANGTGGGSARIRAIYGEVGAKLPIVLLCLTDAPALRIQAVDRLFIEIAVPKTWVHLSHAREIDSQHWVSAADIVSLKLAPDNELLIAFYEFLRLRAWRICIEHVYMASLPRQFGDRFTYVAHNCETNLKSQSLVRHPLADELIATVRDAEDWAVSNADLIVGVSDEDLQALTIGRSSGAPSAVVANTAQAPDWDAVGPLSADKPWSAAFIGSGHMPNVEAARFVVEQLAPTRPNIEFHLAGSVCDALAGPLPANAQLHGVLSEVERSRFLADRKICLNPITSGGGSNVKLADYLLHGAPVLTTPFGLRGYAPEVENYVHVASMDGFAEALDEILESVETTDRAGRIAFADATLSPRVQAERFVALLDALATPRKRVLAVTYRYIWPPKGGAEIHFWSFLKALNDDGRFDIDVAATDIADIGSSSRFNSTFTSAAEEGAPTGMERVRYARFAADLLASPNAQAEAARIWRSQPSYEKASYEAIGNDPTDVTLLWGWYWPEQGKDGWFRRAAHDAAIFIPLGVSVRLEGHAPSRTLVRQIAADGTLAGTAALDGVFSFTLVGRGGWIALQGSAEVLSVSDPRPVAFVLKKLTAGNEEIDLSVAQPVTDRAPTHIAKTAALTAAADKVRRPEGINLLRARGPHSPALAEWLGENAARYDLIFTQNCVFETARLAIDAGNAAGVPTLLLPHVHIEDDFYHFPDVEETIAASTVTIVAPQAAADYYRERGATNVRYLSAGLDLDEAYSESDREAFRLLYPDSTPFVLILGRKAASKNYPEVIQVVDELARSRPVRLLMIGFDEDGAPLHSPNVVFLGQQPRDVVRGALMSCLALVNMSGSESFGLVLLEAWAAGRPVVVNRNSAAFTELVRDGENGLLADMADLGDAIARLLDEADLGDALALGGRSELQKRGLRAVAGEFVAICAELASAPKHINEL